MTILFDSARHVNHNRVFGLGLGRNQTTRLPFGSSAADEAWLAANTPRSRMAPTEAEVRANVEARTMSAAEFNARIEEQARDAYEMEVFCKGLVFA